MSDNEKAMLILAIIGIILFCIIKGIEYVAIEESSKTGVDRMLEYERKHPEEARRRCHEYFSMGNDY